MTSSPRALWLLGVALSTSSTTGCGHHGAAAAKALAVAEEVALAGAVAVAQAAAKPAPAAVSDPSTPRLDLPSERRVSSVDFSDCGESGTAILHVTFANDGSARAVSITETSGPLAEAVTLCLRGRAFDLQLEPYVGDLVTTDVPVTLTGGAVIASDGSAQP